MTAGERETKRPRILAALAALGLAGAAGIWWATAPFGPGVSVDSAQYLSAARAIQEGRGCSMNILPWDRDGDWMPLTHFPPLYPSLLAALPSDPVSNARALGAFLFGVNVVLAGWLAGCAAGAGAGLTTAAAALAFPIWWKVHGVAVSEGPFLTLELIFAAALLERPSLGAAALAGASAGLAVLDRYAGFSLVLAGVAWLALSRPFSARRTAVFSAFAFSPGLAWAARNAWLTGRAIDRRLGFSMELFHRLGEAARAILGWLAPPQLTAWAALAVAVWLAAVWKTRRPPTEAARRLAALALAVTAAHVAVVVFSSVFFDPRIPLNERMLLPLAALALPLACAWLADGGPAGPVLLAVWIALQSVGVASVVKRLRAGADFASPDWRNSGLIQTIGLEAAGRLYSNDPNALSCVLGRTARDLPGASPKELDDFRGRLRENDRIVFFERTWMRGLVDELTLVREAGLVEVADYPEGRMYSPPRAK